MLDRRTLMLSLAATFVLPLTDAAAAPNGNGRGPASKGPKGGKKPKKPNKSNNGNSNADGSGNGTPSAGAAGAQPNPSADQALDAVRSGKALPLREIRAMVQQKYPGLLIDAELEQRGGALVYDLTMLSPDGRVLVVSVDAATGKIASQ